MSVPTTKQRGLGSDHQRLRRLLLPQAYGKPCPLCPELMLPGDKLDLDHKTPRCMGGSGGPVRIVHAHCNRRDGGILGNLLKGSRPTPDGRERLEQKPPRWQSPPKQPRW